MFNFNTLKTTILLGSLAGLLIVLGGAIGGAGGAVIGFVMAIVMNLGSYWFSDKIALRMGGAREVSEMETPQLHEMVARLAKRADLPKPRVAISEADAPNAFATGRNPKNGLVAVTTGLMRVLDNREIEAVIAHELGHIKNRDILIQSVAATIGGAVTFIAQMAQFSAMFGGMNRNDDDEGGVGIVGALAMMILAPIAATIIQMAISRTREYGADRAAAEITHDPQALASALQKLDTYAKRIPMHVNPAAAHLFIVKPLTGATLASIFSTHPSTEKRVAHLQEVAKELSGVGNRVTA